MEYYNSDENGYIVLTAEQYQSWIRDQDNFTYYNPASIIGNDASSSECHRFPIIAGGIRYEKISSPVSEEEFKMVTSGGFTVSSIGSIGSTLINNTIKAAAAADIRIFFNNGNFQLRAADGKIQYEDTRFGLRNVLKEYLPWLGGVDVWDEPTYDQLVASPSKYKGLKSVYWNLLSQGTDTIMFINLVGGPVGGFMSQADLNKLPEEEQFEIYKEYIEKFQEQFKPAVFGYDLYPIREFSYILYEGTALAYSPTTEQKNHEGSIEVNDSWFYKDFEIFMDVAKRTNRPFWAYCQGISFMSLSQRLFRPIAKENYLRFEVFNALAYGAQGIIYWTYSMRPTPIEDNGTTVISFFSALLNRDNQKTAAWHFAKKINEEVKTYQDVFLNCKVNSVSTVRAGESISIQGLRTVITFNTNIDIIISDIKSTAGNFLILANRSPLKYGAIKIKLTYGSILELTPEKSQGPGNQTITDGTERILIPGGYRIFKYTKPLQPLG